MKFWNSQDTVEENKTKTARKMCSRELSRVFNVECDLWWSLVVFFKWIYSFFMCESNCNSMIYGRSWTMTTTSNLTTDSEKKLTSSKLQSHHTKHNRLWIVEISLNSDKFFRFSRFILWSISAPLNLLYLNIIFYAINLSSNIMIFIDEKRAFHCVNKSE